MLALSLNTPASMFSSSSVSCISFPEAVFIRSVALALCCVHDPDRLVEEELPRNDELLLGRPRNDAADGTDLFPVVVVDGVEACLANWSPEDGKCSNSSTYTGPFSRGTVNCWEPLFERLKGIVLPS